MRRLFFRFVTIYPFDGQTDRRTDGRTSLDRVCIPCTCSAVKTWTWRGPWVMANVLGMQQIYLISFLCEKRFERNRAKSSMLCLCRLRVPVYLSSFRGYSRLFSSSILSV